MLKFRDLSLILLTYLCHSHVFAQSPAGAVSPDPASRQNSHLPTPLPGTSVFIMPANRTWPIAPAAPVAAPPVVATTPAPPAVSVAPPAAASGGNLPINAKPSSSVSQVFQAAVPSVNQPALGGARGISSLQTNSPNARSTVDAQSGGGAPNTNNAISSGAVGASSRTSSGNRLPEDVRREMLRPGEPADPRQTARQPLDLTNDYRIGSQDLLEIEVFGVKELNRTVRVNAGGVITLPLVGGVTVANLTAQEAEAVIAKTLSDNFMQDPQVSVFIKEFTTQRITVEGAVMKPGIFPLTGQITLLRALALAGGGAQIADLSKVMLFRAGNNESGKPGQTFDVLKIRGGAQPDPVLRNDDVVVVQRDESRRVIKDSLFRDVIDAINPFSAFSR